MDAGTTHALDLGLIAAAMTAVAVAFALRRLVARRVGAAPATAAAAVVVGFALPALAFGLYGLFGPPAAVQGAAEASPRPDAAATGDPAALRAQLVAQIERSPRDGRARVLLARLDFAAARFAEAAEAYAQAIAVSSHVARDPNVWCEYADALGMAQGGSLAGKPRELVAHALTLDAGNPKALEMAGSAAFEQNDPVTAAGYWRQLLAQLPARASERRDLVAAIARAEELAATGPNRRTESR
jgi:cytochrome c-type biogenesis protein CcmH